MLGLQAGTATPRFILLFRGLLPLLEKSLTLVFEAETSFQDLPQGRFPQLSTMQYTGPAVLSPEFLGHLAAFVS